MAMGNKTAKSARKPLLRAARFRIMPLTMTMLGLILVSKLADVAESTRELHVLLSAREARAADAAGSENPPEKKSDTTKADDEKPEDKTEAKPADAGAVESKEVKPEEKHEEKHDGKEGEKKEAKEPEEPKTLGAGKMTIKEVEALKARQTAPQFTQTELDLLQNLVKRREEIEKREQEFEIKSAVLDATEKRINDKVAEMKALQEQLSKVVAEYNKHQDAEIRGLVRIYEAMKPSDAANIFNQLDMQILLEVVDKMSERKVAGVLASMDPKRARDVTQQLAEMRRGRVEMKAAAEALAKASGATPAASPAAAPAPSAPSANATAPAAPATPPATPLAASAPAPASPATPPTMAPPAAAPAPTKP